MSLPDITARITRACDRAGRSPAEITLIAVSKVQPHERVEAVLAAGHRIFGENRVQEAQGKWPAWKEAYRGVELHLLGPLQSNKVRPAVDLFDAIHSLDRAKLARRIADVAQEAGRCPDLFVQVNTGDETQKAGVAPDEADAFIREVRAMDLPVKGVMCIPPVDEAPSLHFALLAKIAARNGLAGLSMGMSADFEEAIALGATHIRVGSAIFGPRAS
ncbi:YggS family pyridoxal phosphate-dependent enzyme [Jannaschia rubra]|uniref:YggS family pyridoxal phosphate-dependent enzyme n=1 Tax=Jannaschia rubra TaxID=282197 RepID=UPI0024926901|nr:YggS family pyridoxal phosphate-dependent enzyme [Jannaschia rubra]